MKILFLSNINFDNKRGVFNAVINRIKYIKNDLEDYNFINIIGRNVSYLELFTKKHNKKILNNIVVNELKNKVFFHRRVLKKININYFIRNNIKFIKKNIKYKNYDLIHAHWAYPIGYIAYKIKEKENIPYVLTVHGSDIHTNPKISKKIKKYTLIALENAEQVEFVSQNLLDYAIKELGYSGENACVIANGIEEKYICDYKLLNKKKNKVGYIGNLIEIKGADRIPEIFTKIHLKNKKVDFIVVGDGVLKKQLCEKCNNNGIKVKFTGGISQNEVLKILKDIDVLIIPSRNEGWPCIILEANACGTYIVATDVGGNREAIDNYGSVVKVDSNLLENMADEVVKVLDFNINYKDIIERSRNFTWDKIKDQELDLYKKILRR